jgi:hypothetical protein
MRIATGTRSVVIRDGRGAKFTVNPVGGGSALVEYSRSSEADMQNGFDVWFPWPKGTVSTLTDDQLTQPASVRVSAIGGLYVDVIVTNLPVVDDPARMWISEAGSSFSISIVYGNNFAGLANSVVTPTPYMRIVSSSGGGIANVVIEWMINGEGSLSGGISASDNDGFFFAPTWTLGSTLGANQIIGRVRGWPEVSVTLNASVIGVSGGTVEAPVITLNDTDPDTFTITCATVGATIYYTTDGSTPSAASTLYSGTFTAVDAAHTLRAIGIMTGMTSSAVVSYSYNPSYQWLHLPVENW